MPDRFHTFLIVLRQAQPDASETTETSDFVTVVSARNLEGAKAEAEKLVQTLNGVFSIVSIEPRDETWIGA